MGDAVNLAARLMARAEPGQILSTAPVLAASPVEFETTDSSRSRSRASGCRCRHSPWARSRARRAAHDDLPLVGRLDEIGRLAQAARRQRQGRGSVIEVVGEPGIGKSRLMVEARRSPAGRSQPVRPCELYTVSPRTRAAASCSARPIGCGPDASAPHWPRCLQDASRALRTRRLAAAVGAPLDIETEPTPGGRPSCRRVSAGPRLNGGRRRTARAGGRRSDSAADRGRALDGRGVGQPARAICGQRPNGPG